MIFLRGWLPGKQSPLFKYSLCAVSINAAWKPFHNLLPWLQHINNTTKRNRAMCLNTVAGRCWYYGIYWYITFLLKSTAINKVKLYTHTHTHKWVPCMPKTKHLPPCALAWGSVPLLGHHRSEHKFVFPKHSPSGCSLLLSSRHSKSHQLAAGNKEETCNICGYRKNPQKYNYIGSLLWICI